MLINDKDSFLGIGWSFPPTFPHAGADVITVSNEENVRQSLEILLQTAKNTRLMHPNFYCDLPAYVFQNQNYQNMSNLKASIASAILNNETRVDLVDVEIDHSNQQSGLLMINITYLIRSANSRQNMVFPFYLAEGVNVQPSTEGGA